MGFAGLVDAPPAVPQDYWSLHMRYISACICGGSIVVLCIGILSSTDMAGKEDKMLPEMAENGVSCSVLQITSPMDQMCRCVIGGHAA
jgi:hypothetical protein